MSINLRILVLWSTLVLCISQSSAFFLSWGRSDPSPPEPIQTPQWPTPFIYQQRLLQSNPPQHYQQQPQQQQQYQTVEPLQQIPMSMPAIPIQVPLQAQLAPAPNIQNVQLVPCLCPVAQEDVEKAMSMSESMYISNNNINKKN